MTELPDSITFTGLSGDERTLDLTGNYSRDMAEAVHEDHYCHDDDSCDIEQARANGFGLAAGHLLVGATEVAAVSAVNEAYEAYLGGAELSRLYELEWPLWVSHHEKYGRECAACGSFTFAHDSYEPDQCAQCHVAFDPIVSRAIETETDKWQEWTVDLDPNNPDAGAITLFIANDYDAEMGLKRIMSLAGVGGYGTARSTIPNQER